MRYPHASILNRSLCTHPVTCFTSQTSGVVSFQGLPADWQNWHEKPLCLLPPARPQDVKSNKHTFRSCQGCDLLSALVGSAPTPDNLSRCCRAGNTQWVHEYLANSLPALPQCAKKAVADLVESRPDFHPLSGWTHVKQLHGHKVASTSCDCTLHYFLIIFWGGMPLHLMQCIPWHHRFKRVKHELVLNTS